MPTVRPTYEHWSRTYQVSAPVAGGQVCSVDASVNSGTIIPAGAAVDKGKIVGVAVDDADLLANISASDASAKTNYTTCFRKCVVPVTFAAAANWGAALKTAANGQVTPMVVGTDAEGLRIGTCYQLGGVASAAVGLAEIDV
jgi:hypothetical protein